MMFLRLVRSWEVMPAGCMPVFHPSTYSAVYVAVAARNAGGERKVGRDLPEGHEGIQNMHTAQRGTPSGPAQH